MNTRHVTALIGALVTVASIGAPIFAPMTDCPTVKIAQEAGRTYIDAGSDIRMRITEAVNGEQNAEVALRGNSAFESSESVYRNLNDGSAVQLDATENGTTKTAMEVFANRDGQKIEWIAAYHGAHSAIVISAFDNEKIRCEKLDNHAASEFIADLSAAHKAQTGKLSFVSSNQVYARLGWSQSN